MRDDKKQQSIRAARDWLDEADASLSKGSGIRGDLKVMLAQAELRHAQEAEPETRGQVWRRRLTRLLPLTAAAVLAALAFYLTPAVAPPQETAGIPAPPAEMQAQPLDETETSAQPEAAVPDAGSAVPAASSRETAAPENTSSQAAQPAAAPAAPAVPAHETQKLMQTAGKALREP